MAPHFCHLFLFLFSPESLPRTKYVIWSAHYVTHYGSDTLGQLSEQSCLSSFRSWIPSMLSFCSFFHPGHLSKRNKHTLPSSSCKMSFYPLPSPTQGERYFMSVKITCILPLIVVKFNTDHRLIVMSLNSYLRVMLEQSYLSFLCFSSASEKSFHPLYHSDVSVIFSHLWILNVFISFYTFAPNIHTQEVLKLWVVGRLNLEDNYWNKYPYLHLVKRGSDVSGSNQSSGGSRCWCFTKSGLSSE